MMKELIKKGDVVDLFFNGPEAGVMCNMKVMHIPVAVGDLWYFENTKNGDVHAINPASQCFDGMKKPKGNDGE